MAVLARFDEQGLWQDTWVCDDWVTRKLAPLGVAWGRWPLRDAAHGNQVERGAPVAQFASGSAEAARAAYGREIAGLQHLCAVRSAEWMAGPVAGRPATHRLRAAEIRFFIEGAGLFFLRDGEHHLGLLCDAGEWVVLPAGLVHVLDTGSAQGLRALRLAEDPVPARLSLAGDPIEPPLAFEAFVEQVLEWTGDADA